MSEIGLTTYPNSDCSSPPAFSVLETRETGNSVICEMFAKVSFIWPKMGNLIAKYSEMCEWIWDDDFTRKIEKRDFHGKFGYKLKNLNRITNIGRSISWWGNVWRSLINFRNCWIFEDQKSKNIISKNNFLLIHIFYLFTLRKILK